MASSPIQTIATMILMLGLGACGSLKRVHECEAVISTVNASLGEIEFQMPDAGASAVAYEQIATEYEQLVKNIDQLQPKDMALNKALASYKEVAERAAKHSRSFSSELASVAKSRAERKNKEVRLNRIRTLAKADLTREATVVRKLNTLCHPH
jgi:hypothetical protein